MSMSLIQCAMRYHECKEIMARFTDAPDCLSKEDGRCKFYENAIFCPKYGVPVGMMLKYGNLFVDTEEVSE